MSFYPDGLFRVVTILSSAGALFKQTIAMVPNLGSIEVLRLQFPEILASTTSGEGFWAL